MSEDKDYVDVLLVEDNPGDVRLTEEAFSECKHAIRLHVASDGVQATAFLRREGTFQNAPRPDMILLDLNLPRKSGREVLAEIKEDPEFRTIPVAILTTSKAEEDVLKSYELQANCYLTKPLDLDRFIEMIRNIGDFWFSTARLKS
ncbi:MAG: response regulator [Chitinivibrionales bacterium]|nr:response regulator [Chitinivibrionales bacterium]